ncbi:MAG: cell division protein FtsA [Fulvimonas sp.]|nr:cell division protein FtsA [Nevskia sp.]MDI3262277.1 cell division protein FtsA [Fulvimonas sp.]
MNRRAAPEYLVSLDVGTSKVAALIGEVVPGGQVRVIGLGSAPSRGLKKGVVVNIEATVDSIRRAVEAAELMANCRVRAAHVSITGTHIKSLNSVGVVPIKSREISTRDVEAVIEAASALAIPADEQTLHVVPQEFVVDGQEGIHDPVGMNAVRLEAKVHVVLGKLSAAQNLYKCVERCGLTVEKLVLQHLASSDAVLSPDERELGVAVVDIGGGTSDIAVYKGGSIRHTAVVPIAGDLVTSDVAVGFRTPGQYAERIKLEYGCALPEMVQNDPGIEVPGIGETPPRKLSRHMLAEVMRPRYEELFRYVRKELHRADVYDLIAGGVVLTGGVAQTPGILELAEEVLEVGVRLGLPHQVEGLEEVTRSPAYAAGVGLLLFARQQRPSAGGSRGAAAGLRHWMGRMQSWWKGHF